MPKHEYTASEAIALLLQKIGNASPALAERIRIAINAGKEIHVIDDSASKKRGKKLRYYRKNAPFTDEEALSVLIEVLEAHLVEVRLFANSAAKEFAQAGLAGPKPLEIEKARAEEVDATGAGQDKSIEIEVEPETIQKPQGLPNAPLPTADPGQVRSLQEIIEKLSVLLDFTGA